MSLGLECPHRDPQQGHRIEAALALHDLSAALPGQVHRTVAVTWHNWRLRVPSGLVLHFADIADPDRSSFGAVSLIAPLRAPRDRIEANVAPSLPAQAIRQARRRGLITAEDEARLGEQLVAESEAAAR